MQVKGTVEDHKMVSLSPQHKWFLVIGFLLQTIEVNNTTGQSRPACRELPNLLLGVEGHVQELHLLSSLYPLVAPHSNQPPLHHCKAMVGPG